MTSDGLRRFWGLLKKTYTNWGQDEASRKAAALAYYAIFAIAPLLLVSIAITGLIFERPNAVDYLSAQAGRLAGDEGADVVRMVAENTAGSVSGVLPSAIGAALLLFTASGVFVQLKAILNRIWGVEAPDAGGFWFRVRSRLLAIAAVIGIGALLMITLVANSLLSSLRGEVLNALPAWFPAARILGVTVSFLLTATIFAGLYKFLPDARVAWQDVWIGAALTSVFFIFGQYLLSFYFRRADIGSAYGAAGSLVVLLLWVYYSAQIWLFGAEFTQVYADRYGSKVIPDAEAGQF